MESHWKWMIYRASLVEYKVQLAPFAVNAIKKANGRSVSEIGKYKSYFKCTIKSGMCQNSILIHLFFILL